MSAWIILIGTCTYVYYNCYMDAEVQPKQHSAPLLRFSERMETIITNLQVTSSEAFLFGIWKAVQVLCYFCVSF